MDKNEKIQNRFDRRFNRYFHRIFNNLEQKKFAIFCLARIGYEIIDTQMKFIDKQSTDILFTDKLTL